MELSTIKTKITSLFSHIKLVYVVIFVVLVVIIQGVWAYQTITKTNPSSIQPQSQTSTLPSQSKALNVISLTTPKSQFKIGEMIPVGIDIESNKTTAGVDLIIHYDPNLLSLAPNSLKAPVTLGNIYDQYPINQIDEKSGVVTVSGISSKSGGIIPKGLFGTILFQAKAAGSAKVFLEFTPDRTNDTNVIDIKTSTDALEEVKNLDLKITP